MHIRLKDASRLSAALLLMLAWLSAGCESGEDASANADDAPRVEPAEVSLQPGGAGVPLRVVNGRPPFLWQVVDAELGSLSGTATNAAGSQGWSYAVEVTYTPEPGVFGVNTVTVTDKRGWSASSRLRLEP